MRSVDIAILGSGIRGLWLSTELAKLGWSVTWIQLHTPETNLLKNGFEFDDWPWQVGPYYGHSKLIQLAEKFILKVINPEIQDVSVQVLTRQGPLELSGGNEARTLKKFFPESHAVIEEYLSCMSKAQKMGEKKGGQLVSAHSKKIFEMPLGRRWVLEWLGSLRRTRQISTQEWVVNRGEEILDPKVPFWILKDGLSEIAERGMAWAEKQGVTIHRGARIAGIEISGKKAAGVVFDRAEGFLQSQRIIFSCSYQMIESKFPKFATEIRNPLVTSQSSVVWLRCGFFLKPGSKPAALNHFSSFVLDPLMPLMGQNFGLLRWKSSEKGDSLTVWARAPFEEVKRRSFLEGLMESTRQSLSEFFPWFSSQIVGTFSFEDYFQSQRFSHDDLSYVFQQKNEFRPQNTRLKNVYLAGPEFDRGLELLSQMATELRLLEKLAEIRLKELPRDRTIHSSRNGQNLVNPK